jgi:hypothetical protein
MQFKSDKRRRSRTDRIDFDSEKKIGKGYRDDNLLDET